jgi:4-diphosphocytidyl-2-C-methyl-D-erythritol kinase
MLRLLSHAKLNWHLEVVRKRADGYHELRTIFQTIDLADTLEIERRGSGIELEIDGAAEGLEATRGNLAWRAAELYQDRFGGDAGARIRLVKRVPVGAGLGGGSSNAATVLAGLARLDGRDPSDPRLLAAAAELGADVPFFLVGGLAAGFDRGDRIVALADPPESRALLWLSVPPFAVSTREVFEAHRVVAAPRPLGATLARVVAGEARFDPARGEGWNDLEPTCFRLHRVLGEVYNQLSDSGATWVRMSGSGGTICALFDDPAAAEPAGSNLPDGFRWIRSRPLGRDEWRRSAGF